MADAPTPKGGLKFSSLFSGSKQIPEASYQGYLYSAWIVDGAFFWLPGADTTFIGFCRLMYLINGYHTDKIAVTTAVNALAGLLPLVPCSTLFVWTSYKINVFETSKFGASVAGKAVRNRALKSGNEYLAKRSGSGNPQGPEKESAVREINGTKPNQSVGYEQKGVTGNGIAVPPTTAADKSIGYRNTEKQERPETRGSNPERQNVAYGADRNVDGVIGPPEIPARRNEAYTPTQPVFRRPASDNPEDRGTAYQEAA